MLVTRLDLSLHDGGAGGGTGAGAGAAGGGAAGAGSAANSAGNSGAGNSGAAAGARREAKANGEPQILYGKQPQELNSAGEQQADGKNAEDAGSGADAKNEADAKRAADKKAAWRQLIEGEYKEEFGQAVKQAIERRFKQVKPMEERLEQLDPLVEMLATRYGVEDKEPGKIMQALEADDVYWEEAADEAGMTVEQYRHMQRLERENARFQAQMQQQAAEKKAREQVAQWQQEASELQRIYPQFDLRHECDNPQFVKMLAHVPMKTAYEALHMQEIMQGAVTQTARAVEKGVTENIRAKGQRPAEAGLATAAGVEIKSDPSKLTRKDLRRIRELAARGEKIRF